jgi:hypothetical protein
MGGWLDLFWRNSCPESYSLPTISNEVSVLELETVIKKSLNIGRTPSGLNSNHSHAACSDAIRLGGMLMSKHGCPVHAVFAVAAIVLVSSSAGRQQPWGGAAYQLKPTPKTIAWGYYDASTPPVMRVQSGDTVEVRTVFGGVDPAQLEAAGVPPGQVEQSLRDIYTQVTDKGPGGHILTGPIYVQGADPGDVLEVQIQSIRLAIPYAYNRFAPCRGALPDDFPYARLRVIPLDKTRMVATFQTS